MHTIVVILSALATQERMDALTALADPYLD
jgi:hypothetical protein